jgi:hypothetical protein
VSSEFATVLDPDLPAEGMRDAVSGDHVSAALDIDADLAVRQRHPQYVGECGRRAQHKAVQWCLHRFQTQSWRISENRAAGVTVYLDLDEALEAAGLPE